MLHDVDFTTIRPVQSLVGLGQHPYGRPKTLCHIEFRPDFEATKPETFLVHAPNATRKKRRIVIGKEVVNHAAQHKASVLKSI